MKAFWTVVLLLIVLIVGLVSIPKTRELASKKQASLAKQTKKKLPKPVKKLVKK